MRKTVLATAGISLGPFVITKRLLGQSFSNTGCFTAQTINSVTSAVNNAQYHLAANSVTPADFQNLMIANNAWFGNANHAGMLPTIAQGFAQTSSVPSYNGGWQDEMVQKVWGMPGTSAPPFATHPNAQPRTAQVNYINASNLVTTVYENINSVLGRQYAGQTGVAALAPNPQPAHLAYAVDRRRDYRLLRVEEPPPHKIPYGCVTESQAAIAAAGGGVVAAGGWGLIDASGLSFVDIAVETSLLAASLFWAGVLIGMLGIAFAGYYTYEYVTAEAGGQGCVVSNGSNAAGVTGK